MRQNTSLHDTTQTETRLSATRRARLIAGRSRRRARKRVRLAAQTVSGAVTPIGWFVLFLLVAGIAAGALWRWAEAWTVGIIALVLVLFALPFLIGVRRYQVSITLPQNRVMVGEELKVDVTFENPGAAPALAAKAELPVGEAIKQLRVPWLAPAASATLPLSIPVEKRGVIQVGPVGFVRSDPIGLFRRETTWQEARSVIVHPRWVFLPPYSEGLVRDLEGGASRKITDSDLSFYAVREYQPGDALRHVHWKATAKTGQLLVRQYEESQTARVAVLFDANPAGYGNAAEFELGVSAAASVAVRTVREGKDYFVASAWARGRVRPSATGLEEIPGPNPTAMLDEFALLQAVPEAAPLPQLARVLGATRRDFSVVVIVTGSTLAHAELQRLRAAFNPNVRLEIVRCELYAEPSEQWAAQQRIMTIGALADLQQLLARRR